MKWHLVDLAAAFDFLLQQVATEIVKNQLSSICKFFSVLVLSFVLHLTLVNIEEAIRLASASVVIFENGRKMMVFVGLHLKAFVFKLRS